MKIAVASDLHGHWYSLEYPDADLLIISGDIFDLYAMDRVVNARDQLAELKQLNLFLTNHANKYQKIIVIGGNHDDAFQIFPDESRKILTAATYLQDEVCYFGGYKIYGSPWQPWLSNMAFNFINHYADYFGAREQAENIWGQIPDDVNILITHTPPLYILDKTTKGLNVGCQYLADRIESLGSLILHVFGHVHAGRGFLEKDGLLHVNAANCHSHDKIAHPMYVIEVSEEGIAKVI